MKIQVTVSSLVCTNAKRRIFNSLGLKLLRMWDTTSHHTSSLGCCGSKKKSVDQCKKKCKQYAQVITDYSW